MMLQEIIIDEEFERILPRLDEQTYAWLEENILEYGCREPLVLWNGILIDGHNRYSILQKHNLPVKIINMEFDSREEVLIWIISTQVSRRNLNPLQLSYYRGLHYHADKKVQGTNNQHAQKSEKPHSETFQPNTARRLADHYNVSRNTISRDAQLANAINAIGEVSSDVKVDILSGKTNITRRQLRELASGNDKDISKVVDRIIAGTLEGFAGRASNDGNSDASNDRDTGSNELRSWEIQFGKMTDEFRIVLRKHAEADDTESVRSALRQYIGMLEELYGSI